MLCAMQDRSLSPAGDCPGLSRDFRRPRTTREAGITAVDTRHESLIKVFAAAGGLTAQNHAEGGPLVTSDYPAAATFRKRPEIINTGSWGKPALTRPRSRRRAPQSGISRLPITALHRAACHSSVVNEMRREGPFCHAGYGRFRSSFRLPGGTSGSEFRDVGVARRGACGDPA
jgi:hypothetical protein